MEDTNWVIKRLGSFHYFPDQAAAEQFAAAAQASLVTHMEVTQDPRTGQWVVVQLLKYLSTNHQGERAYALPDVQQPTK